MKTIRTKRNKIKKKTQKIKRNKTKRKKTKRNNKRKTKTKKNNKRVRRSFIKNTRKRTKKYTRKIMKGGMKIEIPSSIIGGDKYYQVETPVVGTRLIKEQEKINEVAKFLKEATMNPKLAPFVCYALWKKGINNPDEWIHKLHSMNFAEFDDMIKWATMYYNLKQMPSSTIATMKSNPDAEERASADAAREEAVKMIDYSSTGDILDQLADTNAILQAISKVTPGKGKNYEKSVEGYYDFDEVFKKNQEAEELSSATAAEAERPVELDTEGQAKAEAPPAAEYTTGEEDASQTNIDLLLQNIDAELRKDD